MSQDYEVKQKQFFAKLLAEPTNNMCADCGSKSPRWASWNLGSFICIRCSGIHRKLGVHITKVKSVTLDKWTDEQLLSMTNGGNAKVNQLYNPSNVQLDPSALGSGGDADRRLEQFIRDKYEFKRYMNGSAPSYGQSNIQQQQTQQRSAPTSNQSFPYNNELKQLVGMGFEESLVREALQSSRGSVPSAVEYIVAHRRPSTTTIQPSNNSNNTGAPREYFKDAPRTLTKEVSATGQVLNQGTSPLIKQLHNMGFTNDAQNMAAINQANGSLELAVEMLAEGKVKTTKQPQIQQQQKAAPKQDLLGLFDTPEPQNNNDFGDFQNSTPAQSQISSNTSKKMNANDILGLFDSAPMQPQQPIQQQYQQSPPMQQQQFQQNYQQTAQNYGQQQNQQSPPQQQFGQFQQQPQHVTSPPQSHVSDSNPFGAPQQQFGQSQQSPPQQQFGHFQQSPPQQQFQQQAQFGQFQQSPPRQQMPQPTGNPFANSPPISQVSSNYTAQPQQQQQQFGNPFADPRPQQQMQSGGFQQPMQTGGFQQQSNPFADDNTANSFGNFAMKKK